MPPALEKSIARLADAVERFEATLGPTPGRWRGADGTAGWNPWSGLSEKERALRIQRLKRAHRRRWASYTPEQRALRAQNLGRPPKDPEKRLERERLRAEASVAFAAAIAANPPEIPARS
jgi:hypothetical protein